MAANDLDPLPRTYHHRRKNVAKLEITAMEERIRDRGAACPARKSLKTRSGGLYRAAFRRRIPMVQVSDILDHSMFQLYFFLYWSKGIEKRHYYATCIVQRAMQAIDMMCWAQSRVARKSSFCRYP